MWLESCYVQSALNPVTTGGTRSRGGLATVVPSPRPDPERNGARTGETGGSDPSPLARGTAARGE